MYHYTYRITNTKERMYYYGVHSCNCLPKEDIGIKYFSSSKNKEFIKDQKENPQDYKYKIIKIFDSRKEAIEHEIFLHNKFNVGINESFYNKAKQTSTDYDTTGKASVKDKDGNIFLVNVDDPRYLLGKLVGVSKGNKMSEEFCQKMSNAKKGYIPSNEHRRKLSEALIGKKKSPEHCLSISLGTDNKGKNHPRFKGYYITPIGTFESPAALTPIISLSQMKIFCNDCDRLISKASYNNSRFFQLFYTYEEIEGRTYRDMGFWRDYI